MNEWVKRMYSNRKQKQVNERRNGDFPAYAGSKALLVDREKIRGLAQYTYQVVKLYAVSKSHCLLAIAYPAKTHVRILAAIKNLPISYVFL